jgi:type IX secretion system PorP/SprF family membrane protein
MKKALFSLVLGLAASVQSFAQEAATYSQYQLYPIFYNPGVTGFSGNHELIVNARKGQASFPGTPVSYTAMYHGSVGDKLGLGGAIFSEKIGDMTTTKIQGNYAFRFRLQKAQIGIGLTTEFINSRANASLLSNPLVNAGDELLEDRVNGQQIFDASAGVHVLYDEKLFVALAVPNTVRTRLDQGPVDAAPVTKPENSAHYVFHFGYIMNRPGQGYSLIPSLAIRSYRDVPFQVDVNVQGRFLDDKLIAALTMRPGTSGIAGFMIGSQFLKNAQVIYSYDIAFGPFQQYHGGSHELTLSYMFQPKGKRPAAAPGDNQ